MTSHQAPAGPTAAVSLIVMFGKVIGAVSKSNSLPQTHCFPDQRATSR